MDDRQTPPSAAAIVGARPEWGRWPTAFDAPDVVDRAWTELVAAREPGERTELRRAFAFMRARHRGQLRRGSATPFWVHPARVAMRAAQWGHSEATLLQAALLHDTVEDTHTSSAEIAAGFGSDVATLVAWLTAPGEEGPLRAYYARLTIGAPDPVRLLKLADRVDNLRSIEALVIRDSGDHRAWAVRYLRRTAQQIAPLADRHADRAAAELRSAVADLERLLVVPEATPLASITTP